MKTYIKMSKPANNEHHFIAMINKRYFEIRENGEIWRLATKRGKTNYWKIKPRIMNVKINRGYIRLFTWDNGKRISCLAHRIIWSYFNGEIPDDKQINHKNGIKTDNRIENLEVVTQSENKKHSFRMGTEDNKGEKNPHSKLTKSDVKQIRLRYSQGELQKVLAKDYGIYQTHVSRIVNGMSWRYLL